MRLTDWGGDTLIVADALDDDGELAVSIELSGLGDFVFLSTDQARELRDHLNAALGGGTE